jgi:cyclophilin family peptidyl-prolyl cis-trans isomerase
MSKQSKSKRDLKKKRRVRSATTAAQKQRQAQSGRDWTAWWWVGGIAAVVLIAGGVFWFTVGPGKSSVKSAEPAATATVTVEPTESTQEEGAAIMPEDPAARNNMYSAPPAMQIDTSKSYVATFETEKGNIVAELFADKVPTVVNNFVFLAREGFYDNTTFHRVLPGFMAQGGDPMGTGRGGPGYVFPDEFHPDLKHDGPGVLSMANRGPNTNGSQFFITYTATHGLDGKHAVFGQVIEGLDVLESLTPRDSDENPDFTGDLLKTVRIEER